MFLFYPRDTVAELQRILDPEGVADRKAKRLKRRKYLNKVKVN